MGDHAEARKKRALSHEVVARRELRIPENRAFTPQQMGNAEREVSLAGERGADAALARDRGHAGRRRGVLELHVEGPRAHVDGPLVGVLGEIGRRPGGRGIAGRAEERESRRNRREVSQHCLGPRRHSPTSP